MTMEDSLFEVSSYPSMSTDLPARVKIDGLESYKEPCGTPSALRQAFPSSSPLAEHFKRKPTNEHKQTRVGRWSNEEHELFLEGYRRHGRNWRLIAEVVRTRSHIQIRTHAQKHFIKERKSGVNAINSSDARQEPSIFKRRKVERLPKVAQLGEALAPATSGALAPFASAYEVPPPLDASLGPAVDEEGADPLEGMELQPLDMDPQPPHFQHDQHNTAQQHNQQPHAHHQPHHTAHQHAPQHPYQQDLNTPAAQPPQPPPPQQHMMHQDDGLEIFDLLNDGARPQSQHQHQHQHQHQPHQYHYPAHDDAFAPEWV